MYSCRYKKCEKTYKSKYSLQRHFLIRHKKSKRFGCKQCKKTFSSNQNLKEHVYTHTSEKPLICPFRGCNKLFRQSSQLSSHKKIHFYALKQSGSFSSLSFVKVIFKQLTDLLSEQKQSEELLRKGLDSVMIFELPSIFSPKDLIF